MPRVEIVNVVATADLGQNVDLEKVGNLEHGIYDEMYYGSRVAYLKSPEMKGKVTIFPSGKLISVGTKSRKQAADELNLATKILVEAGLIGTIPLKVRVRNAVATVDLQRALDLNKIAKNSGEVVYEPEQFPGAICRLTELPEITILLFASGKAVITGIRDQDYLDPIMDAMMRFLDSEH